MTTTKTSKKRFALTCMTALLGLSAGTAYAWNSTPPQTNACVWFRTVMAIAGHGDMGCSKKTTVNDFACQADSLPGVYTIHTVPSAGGTVAHGYIYNPQGGLIQHILCTSAECNPV